MRGFVRGAGGRGAEGVKSGLYERGGFTVASLVTVERAEKTTSSEHINGGQWNEAHYSRKVIFIYLK